MPYPVKKQHMKRSIYKLKCGKNKINRLVFY